MPLRQEFVYELAHELAHVKMGAGVSNYLVETLAVAVSHEVLSRLGMGQFSDAVTKLDTKELPKEISNAVDHQDFVALRKYWQRRREDEADCFDDRPFQAVGAFLIRSRTVQWSALLNLATLSSNCSPTPPTNFRICQPTMSRLRSVGPILVALGYRVGQD